jgi:probable addiction module antidote protein
MSYKADLLVDLKSLDYCAKYLRAAIVDSVEAFLVALRDVAEAQRGMTKLASAAGVNRENLYRMLSGRGNPRLNNLKAVLDAVGLQIVFTPVGRGRAVTHAKSIIDQGATAVPAGAISCPVQGNSTKASGSFIASIGPIGTGTWGVGQETTAQHWTPVLETGSGGQGVERAYFLPPGFLNQMPTTHVPY